MKGIKEVLNETYNLNQDKLIEDYDKAIESNSTLKKVVENLNLPKSYLMKYTTSLEETAKELKNCKHCKNILECKNSYPGYVFYPDILSDNLVFDYVPCKYKKELDKKNKYKENIYLFDVPKEIKEASMKNIDINDPNRFEIIKWLKNFLDTYQPKSGMKGLYLNGNFGCGKTYMIAATLNELSKKGIKSAIVYWPEFLRSLKESFDDDFKERFNYIKKINILLIDDIGAENVTPWGRDEILGTILQYRMENGLTTFFTSNLTYDELETVLSLSKGKIEELKATRIMERIKNLSINMSLIGENRRK